MRFTSAREAIQSLGNTADDVASSLKMLGVKGLLGDACSCPLAKFLTNCGFVSPAIDESEIAHGPYTEMSQEVTPAQAEDFIRKFDKGEYKFLEEEPPLSTGDEDEPT